MKTIFVGTSKFASVILDGLIGGKYKPVLVITVPEKPVGRDQELTPSPVKLKAQESNIPVEQPEKIEDSLSKIKSLEPDLIVVSAYGQILPQEVLDVPKKGCLNIHPSLLPRWRGASPIQYTILKGDRKSGATVILMDVKMDHGPILNQRTIELEEKETGKSLHNKLASLGKNLLLETIPRWERNLVKPSIQDEGKATYSRALLKEDAKINWKKSAEELERQVRAFDLWPGTFTLWEKEGKSLRVKILKASVLKTTGINYPVGKTLLVPEGSQKKLCVQCGHDIPTVMGYRSPSDSEFMPKKGNFLIIEKLQLEGKNEMDSEEFLRGNLDFVGTVLQ